MIKLILWNYLINHRQNASTTWTFHSDFRPFQKTDWMKCVLARSDHYFSIGIRFIQSFIEFVIKRIRNLFVEIHWFIEIFHTNRTRMILNERLIFWVKWLIGVSILDFFFIVLYVFEIAMILRVKYFGNKKFSPLSWLLVQK